MDYYYFILSLLYRSDDFGERCVMDYGCHVYCYYALICRM